MSVLAQSDFLRYTVDNKFNQNLAMTYHDGVDFVLIVLVLQSITGQGVTLNFLENLVSKLHIPHTLQLLRDRLDWRPEIFIFFLCFHGLLFGHRGLLGLL